MCSIALSYEYFLLELAVVSEIFASFRIYVIISFQVMIFRFNIAFARGKVNRLVP